MIPMCVREKIRQTLWKTNGGVGGHTTQINTDNT